jgi:hypothetical protein
VAFSKRCRVVTDCGATSKPLRSTTSKWVSCRNYEAVTMAFATKNGRAYLRDFTCRNYKAVAMALATIIVILPTINSAVATTKPLRWLLLRKMDSQCDWRVWVATTKPLRWLLLHGQYTTLICLMQIRFLREPPFSSLTKLPKSREIPSFPRRKANANIPCFPQQLQVRNQCPVRTACSWFAQRSHGFPGMVAR